MIAPVEKVIADIKAGNYPQALTDGMALLPDAEKALADCKGVIAPKLARKVHHMKEMLKSI